MPAGHVPRLPVAGQQVCGFYDINPNKNGQVQNVVRLAKHYGKQSEVYNGIDIGFHARWRGGALLNGGVSVGRAQSDGSNEKKYSGGEHNS